MSNFRNLTTIDRRKFLLGLTGTAGLTLASAARAQKMGQSPTPDLPLPNAADGGHINEEKFWAHVKSLFPLRPGLIHLNSANFAPSSRPVIEKGEALSNDVNSDPSFENRFKFEESIETVRGALASMLDADPDEIAITRNTSEGNRTVIAGLNLGPQDEVVIWDQNHESNNVAWDVWASRYGFKVVRVSTPRKPKDRTALIKPFAAALNARTRMLAFSHVSNISGVALPAADLCRIAAKKGILTLVDGAQTFGMMNLSLHEMGCDFFTGSAHKWLAGPHETGVLYVRASRIDMLWPSMVTHNWEKMSTAGARKFECLGQRQDSRIEGLKVAVEVHNKLGHQQVEQRIRYLANYLRASIDSLGKIDFLTPAQTEMNAGIIMFMLNTANARGVMETFYNKFNISAVAYPRNDKAAVRFSPNIYITTDEIDVAVRAVSSLL